MRAFAPLFRRFFLALFTQTTHANSRHLFIDQKQTCPKEKPNKSAISPHFLNFKKIHFSIILICAIYAQGIYAIGIYAQGILSIAISTGIKLRFRVETIKTRRRARAGQKQTRRSANGRPISAFNHI